MTFINVCLGKLEYYWVNVDILYLKKEEQHFFSIDTEKAKL